MFFGFWTWQGRNLKNPETQQFFPCSSMEGPPQSFIHLVSHYHTLTQHYLCPAHVKDKNYSHWESKTDTTLSVGTHVIMGIGQVITLLQPDTQDPTTPQWPHFLSRGTCGKLSFHYSSKEAKLEIFPKNFFFSCETKWNPALRLPSGGWHVLNRFTWSIFNLPVRSCRSSWPAHLT